MRLKLLALLILLSPMAVMAHHNHEEQCAEAQDQPQPTKEDREKWFREARELKHKFLVRELDLSKDQQKKFFEVYDKMEDEVRKLQRDTRKMERRTYELGTSATDLDYEKAAEALYEEKMKEGEIEQRYKEELKKILTPKQLFQLPGAERRFTKELMDRHQKLKK